MPCVRLVSTLLLIMLLSACGSPDRESSAAVAPSAQPAATEQSTPRPTTTPAEPSTVPTPPAVYPPSMETLTDLSQLTSYRMHYTMVVTLTEEAQPEQAAGPPYQVAISFITNTNGDLFWSSDTGTNMPTPGIFMLQNMGYMLDQAGGCTAHQIQPHQGPTAPNLLGGFTLENHIGTILTWQLVERGEQVQGHASDHYRVESITAPVGYNPFLMQSDLQPTRSDVWVAQDGGYILQYETIVDVPEMTGDYDMPGATLHWRYELEGSNQLPFPPLPESCLHAEQPTPGPQETTPIATPTARPAPVPADHRPPAMDSLLNIAQLDSYRLRYSATFTPTDPGQQINLWQSAPQNITSIEAPNGDHFHSYGTAEEPSMLGFRIGTIGYQLYNGGTCHAIKLDDEAQLGSMAKYDMDIMKGQLGRITSWQLMQRGEQLQGTTTDHYRVEQVMLPDNLGHSLVVNSFTVIRSDAWIAPDAGYLVKYDTVVEILPSTEAGALPAGLLQWSYTVESADQVLFPELPAACAAATP